jgi:hypothetical protein
MVMGPGSAGSAGFLWSGLSFLEVVGAGGVLVGRVVGGPTRWSAGRPRVRGQRAGAGFDGRGEPAGRRSKTAEAVVVWAFVVHKIRNTREHALGHREGR